MHHTKVPRVILRRCDAYDPDRIRGIIGEAMDELKLRPRGRTMIKPNCVIAHDVFFPHAYTRAEFLDGLLAAVRERDDDVEELWVGERCGITIPTRYAFTEAHYRPVLKRHRATPKYFDEMPQVRRNLFAQGRLRDFIYIPEAVAATQWLITAPKFKAHPWTKVTFNLKLYIGIQDDAHRLIDHDHHLHTKIADLFEVVQPKLCVLDGIIAGAKTMLTPRPFPLGLIVIGDDAVSTDVVCTHIVGLKPQEVDHIRITAERGWGSLKLEDVEITGDVTLEEAQARARGFELSLGKVDTTYNGRSHLQIYNGPPPDTYDYCWGGCPGALDEAMGIIESLQPKARHEMRKLHMVYGAYQGDIKPQGKEKVLVVGDCARWHGDVAGEQVHIPYLYRDRKSINPERVHAGDLVAKIFKFLGEAWRHRGKRVIRIRGCPVSVAENVLWLSALGKTKNPYLDPRILFRFTWEYLISKLFRLAARFRRPRPEALEEPARPSPP